jgi:cobalt-zinc-cadmium efflux system membrane fusion protein
MTSKNETVIQGRSRMRPSYLVVGAAAFVAVGAALFLFRGHSDAGPATRAAVAQTAPPANMANPNGAVALSAQATAKNPIKTVAASMGRLAGDVQVIGNVSYDADHFAIVGPLVSGRITRLNAGVGTTVARGQVIAEIESVDVGDARAALISAQARLAAADANLRRERELADKRISSAREREIAEAQWASERAALRAAHERLRAIGLTNADIRELEDKESTVQGGRVPIRAPIAGTVIERLVTLGEAVEHASDAFKIADLSRVWVLLDLYEKDLARVHVGQALEVRTETYPGEIFRGRVAYVVPVIDMATRTAKVRVEIDNRVGKLRLGQLVNAKLIGTAEATAAPVLTVPRGAVQSIDGKPLVFLKVKNGFERRAIETGVSGGDLVEVRSGLNAGDEVASEGGFLIKSELLR